MFIWYLYNFLFLICVHVLEIFFWFFHICMNLCLRGAENCCLSIQYLIWYLYERLFDICINVCFLFVICVHVLYIFFWICFPICTNVCLRGAENCCLSIRYFIAQEQTGTIWKLHSCGKCPNSQILKNITKRFWRKILARQNMSHTIF